MNYRIQFTANVTGDLKVEEEDMAIKIMKALTNATGLEVEVYRIGGDRLIASSKYVAS